MKNRKKAIYINITLICLTFLVLIGFTYAYYKSTVRGNENPESVAARGRKIEITYSDHVATINMGNIIPGDSNMNNPKIFHVENTGDDPVYYNIIFDNMENEFTIDPTTGYTDWNFKIYEGDSILENDSNLVKSGKIAKSNGQRLMANILINPEEKHDYLLVIEYPYYEDIDQSDDMGMSLSLRLNINESTVLDKGAENTLLYGLTKDILVEEPESIPGQAISNANEAVLMSTDDNYGESFIFRGNVTNNYVNFAGMCWRIVRIQGDGSIKLILEENNGTCEMSDNYFYYSSVNLGYRNETINGVSINKLDYVNPDSNSVGTSYSSFAYGFESTLSSKLGVSDTSRSSVVTKLESYLKPGDWCVSRPAYSDAAGNTKILDINQYYNSNTTFYTQSYIGVITKKNVSLECFDHDDNSLMVENYSDGTPMFVGGLTAEEFIYSGGLYGQSNSSFYLTTSYIWRTITHSRYINGEDYSYRILNGGKIDDNYVSKSYSPRPVINLKNTITYSVNSPLSPGTKTNPYIISVN